MKNKTKIIAILLVTLFTTTFGHSMQLHEQFINANKMSQDQKIEEKFAELPRGAVRAMTYNVHEFRSLQQKNTSAEIFDMIAKSKAAIVALQEATLTDIVVYEEFTRKAGYSSSMCPTSSHGGKEMGNVLLTQFPIQKSWSLNLPYYKDPRCAVIAELLLPDGSNLIVIATHLDNSDALTQREEINTIMAFVNSVEATHNKSKLPVLFLADFNALIDTDPRLEEIRKEDEKKYRETSVIKTTFFNSHGLVDSFALSTKPSPASTCWSNRRIDYIFIKNSHRLSAIDSYLIPIDFSDHLPVVFDFRLL